MNILYNISDIITIFFKFANNSEGRISLNICEINMIINKHFEL